MLLIVSLLSCFGVVSAASLSLNPTERTVTTHNSRSFKNALSQQGYQTILQSIEERLRNLDQVYSMRCSARPVDLNAEQCNRKIEMLEAKLARMESMIEVQLNKISENMSTKNFKDDIVKDQIIRKIDSVYERLNHNIGYVEGKLDMDVLKLQSKMDTSLKKIDRLDHSIGVRQADTETIISDGIVIIENIKSDMGNYESKIIDATKTIIENMYKRQKENIETETANITTKIEGFGKILNQTLQNCHEKDSQNTSLHKETNIFIKKFKEYDDRINSYGSKMANMYNELWKKTEIIENSLKHIDENINYTRTEIQTRAKLPNENQNDETFEIVIDSLQKKFSDMSRKIDSNFENVFLGQNLFLESCHRIQMDESQLENKISLVLESLLDSFTNKSAITTKQLNTLEEFAKTHDDNVFHSNNHISSTILELAEKTTDDRKKIEKTLSNIKQEIGNSIKKFQDALNADNMEHAQKLQNAFDVLQELQDLNDHDIDQNEENPNITATIITNEILSKPTKYFNEQKLISIAEEKSKNETDLMRNIYHILNNIDTKLNKSYLDYYFNPQGYQPQYTHRFTPNKNPNNFFINNDSNIVKNVEIINNSTTENYIPKEKSYIEKFNFINLEKNKSLEKQELEKYNYTIFTENSIEENINETKNDFSYDIFSFFTKYFLTSENKTKNEPMIKTEDNIDNLTKLQVIDQLKDNANASNIEFTNFTYLSDSVEYSDMKNNLTEEIEVEGHIEQTDDPEYDIEYDDEQRQTKYI